MKSKKSWTVYQILILSFLSKYTFIGTMTNMVCLRNLERVSNQYRNAGWVHIDGEFLIKGIFAHGLVLKCLPHNITIFVFEGQVCEGCCVFLWGSLVVVVEDPYGSGSRLVQLLHPYRDGAWHLVVEKYNTA